MAAEVVERGAVWAAFGLLYKAVKETQEKNVNFKPSLEKINRTLEALKPLVEEIQEFKDLPPKEVLGFKSEMEKGADLVLDCSKEVQGFNLFKKTNYKEKLQELDETLQRLIQILGIQGVRDTKETFIQLRELYDVIMNKETNIGFTSKTASSDDQFPSSIAGLDDDTVKKQTKSMAEYLVAGGGVGQAFSKLYDVAKVITIKHMEFKPTLEKINGTLEALKPLLEDIEQSNEKLDLPESEISGFKTEMEKGAELIRKCSEVHGYYIFKRSSYKDKLEELNETLQSLIHILLVQGVRETKNSLLLQEMHATSSIIGNNNNIEEGDTN